jgi:ABC-type branched-subunit amino acid transport system ATPase component
VLELQGLTRRYADIVALDDLSFTVREGRMFGFVGPNGAGKTTAMRIVLGVLEPDWGEVRWRGRPGRRRDPAPLRLHARGPRPNVFSTVRLPAGLPGMQSMRGSTHRQGACRPRAK